jgi:hypothetical protein
MKSRNLVMLSVIHHCLNLLDSEAVLSAYKTGTKNGTNVFMPAGRIKGRTKNNQWKLNVSRKKMEPNQEDMNSGQEEMLTKMDDEQEGMKAQVAALAFRINASQDRLGSKIDTIQEKMNVKMNLHQEMMEDTINSIQSEVEGIIKQWVQGALTCGPKDSGPLLLT